MSASSAVWCFQKKRYAYTAGGPTTWTMTMASEKANMAVCRFVEHSSDRSTRSHDVPSSRSTQ